MLPMPSLRMRSVFKVLRIRLLALLLYIFDCKILLFCFTYLIITIFLIVLFEPYTFEGTQFPLKQFLLFCLILFIVVLVSYRVKSGVNKFGTHVRVLALSFLFAVSICFYHLCKVREEIEKVQSFIGSEVTIYGSVKSLEGNRRSIVDPSTSELGSVLIHESSKSVLHVGDSCTFKGTLVEPRSFDDFDYRIYLYKKGIYSILEVRTVECSSNKDSLLSIRTKLEEVIQRAIPEPESSLLIGIILGSKREFSERFDSAIRNTGVSHIVAASGYNISILLLSVEKFLSFLSKRSRVTFQLIFVWIYTVIAGMSASLLRASTMTTIYLVSVLTSRSSSRHISVFLCITVLLMFNPFLIYDIGFLLSLFSTISLIYFLTSIDRESIPRIFRNYLLPTLSCTLFTLPITVSTFNQVSLVSILVNFLVLPVIESTMIWGILSVISYMIFPSCRILLLVPYLQLLVFKNIVLLFSHVPTLNIVINPVVLLLVSYIFLILFCISMYPIKNEKYNYYIKKADITSQL